MTIFTIGHSNRSFDDFLALLEAFQIKLVADIRHYPGSRKYPHFNREALRVHLPENGIAYRHLLGLGGRRKGRSESKNDGWHHPAFRSYADYAQTADFTCALDELIELARPQRTAIMCSEAVYWRCHRRIVTDYLIARGIEVQHIIGSRHTSPGSLTPFAHVCSDGTILYSEPPSASACP